MAEEAAQDKAPAKTKSGWFSRRRKQAAEPVDATAEAKPATEGDADADATPKKPGGLGGWFGRKKAAAASDDAVAENDSAGDDRDADDGSGGEQVDEDSIDWDNLSKAEKRRMKKQLRRQDRAA